MYSAISSFHYLYGWIEIEKLHKIKKKHQKGIDPQFYQLQKFVQTIFESRLLKFQNKIIKILL